MNNVYRSMQRVGASGIGLRARGWGGVISIPTASNCCQPLSNRCGTASTFPTTAFPNAFNHFCSRSGNQPPASCPLKCLCGTPSPRDKTNEVLCY